MIMALKNRLLLVLLLFNIAGLSVQQGKKIEKFLRNYFYEKEMYRITMLNWI